VAVLAGGIRSWVMSVDVLLQICPADLSFQMSRSAVPWRPTCSYRKPTCRLCPAFQSSACRVDTYMLLAGNPKSYIPTRHHILEFLGGKRSFAIYRASRVRDGAHPLMLSKCVLIWPCDLVGHEMENPVMGMKIGRIRRIARRARCWTCFEGWRCHVCCMAGRHRYAGGVRLEI